MAQIYDWPWVETQIARTMEVWNGCASQCLPGGRTYTLEEQQQREQAFDAGLQAVEWEVRRTPRTKTARIERQNRIVAAFGRFSAAALDLEGETIHLLTNDFLPVGTKLARWAREFDPHLPMPDIIQACRNAWTACGLQPLLGMPVELTPSILGYSLLYPYSDNYLDQQEISPAVKLRFSLRFRRLLRGEDLPAENHREAALQALIELIESQYPRPCYPQVFACLLAIHRAQEQSIQQLTSAGDSLELLALSCGKGGSSVLADACLAQGSLTEEESRFAFEWGVLLQLGDDVQDIREDLRRGSMTLFSSAVSRAEPLDGLVCQLLNFSQAVGIRMDRLPDGAPKLKELLKMSWRSLIIRAVADSHAFFSTAFLAQAERCSPFRFAFLRARRETLAGRQGLYALLFDIFLEARGNDDNQRQLPAPHKRPGFSAGRSLVGVME